MNTLTATNARINLFKLLKKTVKGHLQTRISSYRLTLKDRLIYSIDEDKKIVYLKRARTHYGE